MNIYIQSPSTARFACYKLTRYKDYLCWLSCKDLSEEEIKKLPTIDLYKRQAFNVYIQSGGNFVARAYEEGDLDKIYIQSYPSNGEL